MEEEKIHQHMPLIRGKNFEIIEKKNAIQFFSEENYDNRKNHKLRLDMNYIQFVGI